MNSAVVVAGNSGAGVAADSVGGSEAVAAAVECSGVAASAPIFDGF